MNSAFASFLKTLELTESQETDAKTKYNGVCETLHNSFYGTEYDGSSKLLFGSYKKKTNIRPIIPNQDVDVLFKLPIEVFNQYDAHEGNGQSELLRKIKVILEASYPTTKEIKGWTKVVLVEFSQGRHNVEVLPAFEENDGTFIIPNTEGGGRWERFDPRGELGCFFESNKQTNNLTREFSKMLKKWSRENILLSVKSFQLENAIIDFFDGYSSVSLNYAVILRDIFFFLRARFDEHDVSYATTALKRSDKALEFMLEGKLESAFDEWSKIFGKEFPSYSSIYNTSEKALAAPKEQFIDEIATVDVSHGYDFKIDCWTELPGFRDGWLSGFISSGIPLNKKKGLEFRIVECNVPRPFSIKWKVRNFGKEAEGKGQLRGEIVNDEGRQIKKESTSYQGEHYVECYAIKDNVCVARSQIKVPIN